MGNVVNNILLVVLSLALGIVFGIAGTAVHAYFIGPIPVGLIVALIASAALMLSLRLLLEKRWCSVVSFVGMIAIIYIMAQASVNGSVLITNNFESFAWIYGVAIIGLVIQTFPSLKLSKEAQTPEKHAVTFR